MLISVATRAFSALVSSISLIINGQHNSSSSHGIGVIEPVLSQNTEGALRHCLMS